MNKTTLGIDLGTCSTSAAFLMGGRIEPVNLSGVQFSSTPSMPTIVAVDDSGRIVVGPNAERQRAKGRAIYEFKLEMERSPGRWVDVAGAPRMIPWIEIVTAILCHVKGVAERDGNNSNPIEHAVLTVPALYAKGGTAWNLMEEAGRQAGFRTIDIIREPHAAALYYDHLLTRAGRAPSQVGDYVLIYDLGGGTFDPALIHRSQDAYPVERAGNGVACGGIFLDAKLREDFARKCPASAPIAPLRNPDGSTPQTEMAASARYIRDGNDIRGFLLTCKHSFSDPAQKEFRADAPPLEMECYSISRTEFDHMIAPMLDSTIECCEALLRRSRVSWGDLAAVVLVGGSCALPAVRARLASAITDAGGDSRRIVWQRIPGTDILIDPGTAVCRGAAWFAAPAPEKATAVAAGQMSPPALPQALTVTPPPILSMPPAVAQPLAAAVSLAEAEQKARKVVNKWTARAVGVGWIPGSMVALAAGDILICRQVAECFQVTDWSKESVGAAIGASVAGKVVATEALSFIPVVGWAVKAGVAGGVTKAVGETIIRYFRERSPLK